MAPVTRPYNDIKPDGFQCILKRSVNAKLADEANYYREIERSSESVKALFPKMIRFDDKKSPYLELYLEKIPYDNAYEFLLKKRKELDTDKMVDFSDKFMKSLIWGMETLHNERFVDILDNNQIHDSWKKMYVEKTEDEFSKISPSIEIPKSSKHIFINGKQYRNFEQIWPLLKKKYLTDYKPYYITHIHGDFCLSNILVTEDPNEELFFKFIDMRGSFGNNVGTCGDQIYDYAKLLHSLEGDYEEIIYDDFEILQYSNEYHFYTSNRLKMLKEIARQNLFSYMYRHGIDTTMTRLIEGTIFIGMIARHYDNTETTKKRAHAMYLTGIKLLNEVYEKC